MGDTVYGSDRGKIGTVEEVVPAQDGAPAYLVVPRGLVFDKDTFIPLDAVTHRAKDRVFINIPKLVIGKLPWAERPTAETARSKLGPPIRRGECALPRPRALRATGKGPLRACDCPAENPTVASELPFTRSMPGDAPTGEHSTERDYLAASLVLRTV